MPPPQERAPSTPSAGSSGGLGRLGAHGISALDAGTIVVLPSLSFPAEELRKISGIEHYEERLLFVAMLLARPEIEIVYITSAPLDERIIDYYLAFLGPAHEPRARLKLVSLGDTSPRSLSEKLLERSDVIERVRSLVRDPEHSYILSFNVSTNEEGLSRALGVPLYGPSVERTALGSKTGSRRVAAEAGVAVPDGYDGLNSLAEVEAAVAELRARRPDITAIVIKLNNGFSGQGNAILDPAFLTSPITDSPVTFCSADESWPSFASKIEAEGAIVEQLIRRPGTVSPSAQMLIAPDGSFEPVSTHDQILGGPDQQVYLGCRFPADPLYRLEIQRLGLAVAEVLASKGVIGSFGVDFVVTPSAEGYDVYLSEINLRMGGTTHPFFMAEFATGGSYDPATGELVANAKSKFYVGSDNLKSDDYVGLTPADVIDAIERADLAFDPERGTGTTLHLLGALARHGKMGAVCIGDSRGEAEDLYVLVQKTLDELGASRTGPARA